MRVNLLKFIIDNKIRANTEKSKSVFINQFLIFENSFLNSLKKLSDYIIEWKINMLNVI